MEYDDPDPELADRARRFIEEVVLPVERERAGEEPIPESVVADLRDRAREYDVYAPQVSDAYGGMGLDLRTALPVFEAAGRSLLGPPALRVNTPDQANVHLLERLGTDAQRERWLRPLVAGEAKSAFALSEPPPGAGSDSTMLETTAERDGAEWILNGHKWWTTQGTEAAVLFTVARTGGETGAHSIFLVPADADGVRIVREIRGAGRHGLAGHAEIRFEDVRLPETAVVGDVNAGLEHARERLPASRLGRCMRYAGMADRALSIAKAYVTEREAEGEPLASKQSIRFEIATAEADLHAVRTLIRDTASRFVEASAAEVPISMCTTTTTTAVEEVVGTAVQACGGHGFAKDLPLGDFYERIRPTNDRISNVGHKRRIADSVLEERRIDERELDPMTRFESR